MAGLMYDCFYNLKLIFEPLINIVSSSVRCLANCWLNKHERQQNYQGYNH